MIKRFISKLEQFYYIPVVNTAIKGFLGWFFEFVIIGALGYLAFIGMANLFK